MRQIVASFALILLLLLWTIEVTFTKKVVDQSTSFL